MTVHDRLHGVPVTKNVTAVPQQPPWRRWRRHQLVAAGFDEVTAERLATDERVDLHATLILLDQGCSPQLAAQIAIETSLGDK